MAEGAVGLYVYVDFPFGQVLGVEEDDRYARFEFSIKAGGLTLTAKHFFDGDGSWGWSRFFDKSWAEVVCPDSPYFPGGVMAVEVTMKPITNK